MNSGRKAGLLFGIGLSVGLGIWGLVAATGLGVLLQGTSTLLSGLKLFGGLYLLWLAFQSGRSAMRTTDIGEAAPELGQWFRRGLFLNLSNPKAVLAWMAALSMGLGEEASTSMVGAATLICVALGFVNYALYAVTFSLPGFMSGYKRLRRGIDGIVAGLFAIAGFSLIRSALAR